MSAFSMTADKKIHLRRQTLATFLAVAAAVALPQLFHALGALSGLGTALGETFLPMHLPVLLAGLLAGSAVGAVSGALAPLISFWLTGMPTAVMLPFMMIELAIYGLVAGLLCRRRMPVILKVLVAQLAGRAVRAVAILIAVYGFGSTAVPVAVIYRSIATGSFGILLQWVLLPLLVYRVEGGTRHER